LQVRLDKQFCKALEIAQRDSMQWFLDSIKEPCGIGPVRSLRVWAAPVEPEFDQVIVRLGLSRDHVAVGGRWDHSVFRRFWRMQDNTPSHA
jgi:hypothetical protein